MAPGSTRSSASPLSATRWGLVAGVLGVCQPLALGAAAQGTGDADTAGRPARPLLSSGQSRAARGWLSWSVRDLAEASQISPATINRFEADPTGTAVRRSSVNAIRKTFETRGISFFDDVTGCPAISKQT